MTEEEKIPLLFRALFGLAVIYGCNDMSDECYAAVGSLQSILDSYQCIGYSAIGQPVGVVLLANTASVQRPIYGPDRVSVRDCIDFAQSTARQCRYLIDLVPKNSLRMTLHILIDGLEKSSIDCCKEGGIWKACLQPLTNKWYQWNQKWTIFGIPPDPAWD